MNPPPLLRICGLQKRFGTKEVLRDVSFEVPEGGLLSILGASGTGKSVLLRCVVGLLEADAGEVFFRNQSVQLPPFRGPLRAASSYVFQHNALFDTATVLENLLVPLRARNGSDTPEHREKALSLLRRMELEEAAARYPAELSGGMQKRLAVARALVTDPDLVFFDEPTAGLDPIRRNAVFEMILRLQQERRFTAVLVTHDVREALIVSSRVVWLESGGVAFSGTPAEFEAQSDPKFGRFRDNLESLRRSVQEAARGN